MTWLRFPRVRAVAGRGDRTPGNAAAASEGGRGGELRAGVGRRVGGPPHAQSRVHGGNLPVDARIGKDRGPDPARCAASRTVTAGSSRPMPSILSARGVHALVDLVAVLAAGHLVGLVSGALHAVLAPCRCARPWRRWPCPSSSSNLSLIPMVAPQDVSDISTPTLGQVTPPVRRLDKRADERRARYGDRDERARSGPRHLLGARDGLRRRRETAARRAGPAQGGPRRRRGRHRRRHAGRGALPRRARGVPRRAVRRRPPRRRRAGRRLRAVALGAAARRRAAGRSGRC